MNICHSDAVESVHKLVKLPPDFCESEADSAGDVDDVISVYKGKYVYVRRNGAIHCVYVKFDHSVFVESWDSSGEKFRCSDGKVRYLRRIAVNNSDRMSLYSIMGDLTVRHCYESDLLEHQFISSLTRRSTSRTDYVVITAASYENRDVFVVTFSNPNDVKKAKEQKVHRANSILLDICSDCDATLNNMKPRCSSGKESGFHLEDVVGHIADTAKTYTSCDNTFNDVASRTVIFDQKGINAILKGRHDLILVHNTTHVVDHLDEDESGCLKISHSLFGGRVSFVGMIFRVDVSLSLPLLSSSRLLQFYCNLNRKIEKGFCKVDHLSRCTAIPMAEDVNLIDLMYYRDLKSKGIIICICDVCDRSPTHVRGCDVPESNGQGSVSTAVANGAIRRAESGYFDTFCFELECTNSMVRSLLEHHKWMSTSEMDLEVAFVLHLVKRMILKRISISDFQEWVNSSSKILSPKLRKYIHSVHTKFLDEVENAIGSNRVIARNGSIYCVNSEKKKYDEAIEWVGSLPFKSLKVIRRYEKLLYLDRKNYHFLEYIPTKHPSGDEDNVEGHEDTGRPFDFRKRIRSVSEVPVPLDFLVSIFRNEKIPNEYFYKSSMNRSVDTFYLLRLYEQVTDCESLIFDCYNLAGKSRFDEDEDHEHECVMSICKCKNVGYRGTKCLKCYRMME